MGIHFVCHHCSYALHVKDFQAGKRGKCPNCKGSFRIPANDSPYSSAIEESIESSAVTNLRNSFQQANQKTNGKQDQSSSDSIAIAMEPNPVTKAVTSDSKKTSENVPKSGDSKSAKTVSKVAAVNQESSIDSPVLPPALSEAANANWFVRPPSGGQFGPAPSHLLMSWITESRVTAESYLWREGFADWQLASELLPELFQEASGPSIAPPSLKEILSDEPSNPTPGVLEMNPDSASATRAGLLLKKQMQKRRQQLIMIVMLAVISLILFGILIFVLVFQATKSPQPAQSYIPPGRATWEGESTPANMFTSSSLNQFVTRVG